LLAGGTDAKDGALVGEFLDRAIGHAQQRAGMTSRRVREYECGRVDNADERRHLVVGEFLAQRPAGGVEDHDWIRMNVRDAANHLSHRGHRDRCAETATRNVADGNDDSAVGQSHRVVPVASDMRFVVAREVRCVEAETGDVRQPRR
jgi:hypothetical protein